MALVGCWVSKTIICSSPAGRFALVQTNHKDSESLLFYLQPSGFSILEAVALAQNLPRSMPSSQLPEVLLVKSYAVYSFAQYTSVPYRTTGWPGWIFYSTLEDDLHGSNPTLLFTPKQLIVMYVNHLYPPVFHSISSVLIHTQFTMSNKMGFNHQPLISRSVVTTKALRVASWCGVGRTQRGHWWFRMRSTKIGTCPRFTGSYLLVVYVSAPLKVGTNDVEQMMYIYNI